MKVITSSHHLTFLYILEFVFPFVFLDLVHSTLEAPLHRKSEANKFSSSNLSNGILSLLNLCKNLLILAAVIDERSDFCYTVRTRSVNAVVNQTLDGVNSPLLT